MVRTADLRNAKRRPAHQHCGFTLIEVLVVVAIIGLLLAILLPALSHARSSAKRAVCMANLRNIGFATEEYVQFNRDWLPVPATQGKWGYRKAPGMISERYPMQDQFPGEAKPEIYGLPALYERLRMIKKGNVWICPAASSEMMSNGNTYAWFSSLLLKHYKRPTKIVRSNVTRAFVWDNYEYRAGLTGRIPYATTSPVFHLNETAVRQYYFIPNEERYYPHLLNTIAATQSSAPSSKGVNALFFDGHVGLRAKPR